MVLKHLIAACAATAARDKWRKTADGAIYRLVIQLLAIDERNTPVTDREYVYNAARLIRKYPTPGYIRYRIHAVNYVRLAR